MTPAELRAIARKIHGPINDNQIKHRLALDLHVHPRTVAKWLYAERRVPGPAVVALGLMVKAAKHNRMSDGA